MRSRVTTYTLLVGLFFALILLIQRASGFRLPGNQQGYGPVQPIAFSHQLHAGELEVDCQYCHSGAERSRHAGIPAAGVCMNCHRFVKASWGAVREEDSQAAAEARSPQAVVSPEIAKLYRHMGLNPEGQPDPGIDPRPIQWIKVHSLPDFVYFDHRAHLAGGISCQSCHGPVETMVRLRQEETLGMGWCVDCHRKSNVNRQSANALLDCSTCHY